jgi:hypothetical protein
VMSERGVLAAVLGWAEWLAPPAAPTVPLAAVCAGLPLQATRARTQQPGTMINNPLSGTQLA